MIPNSILPRVDAYKDTGKLVLALLDTPAGTTLLGTGAENTYAEMAALWGNIVGVQARFKQVSLEECVDRVPYGAGIDIAESLLVLRFGS